MWVNKFTITVKSRKLESLETKQKIKSFWTQKEVQGELHRESFFQSLLRLRGNCESFIKLRIVSRIPWEWSFLKNQVFDAIDCEWVSCTFWEDSPLGRESILWKVNLHDPASCFRLDLIFKRNSIGTLHLALKFLFLFSKIQF